MGREHLTFLNEHLTFNLTSIDNFSAPCAKRKKKMVLNLIRLFSMHFSMLVIISLLYGTTIQT
jgi:hypothetical protein